jgi:hypothetical protein
LIFLITEFRGKRDRLAFGLIILFTGFLNRIGQLILSRETDLIFGNGFEMGLGNL